MAEVFLSYDREDEVRGRRIAEAIEKAGHSVWWDRRIKSGAQYGREIDEALRRADAVVVLWSGKSVESAWVRDEAATGRDSGKLVPARIDSVDPPLGFRQYQTTDLTRWTGRRKSAEFEGLLEGIASLASGTDAPSDHPAPGAPARTPPTSRQWLAMAIGIFAVAALGLLAWHFLSRSSSVPVVAVAAADGSPQSQALARDLLVKLGALQATRAGSLNLVSDQDAGGDPALTFEVARSGEGGAEANVVLLGAGDRSVLWARDIRDPAGNEADLRQQLAYAAAHVLGCALETLDPATRRLEGASLKTYLNACSLAPDASPGEMAELIPGLQQLVQDAPHFAGGWAKLLQAEAAVAMDVTKPEDAALRQALMRRVAEARKRHPDLAEAYLVEARLAASPEFLKRSQLPDRAIAANPDDAELRSTRSIFLTYVGRLDEAVVDAARAVELDPLSPSTRNAYITALAFSGRLDEALEELREAERLWPGASNVIGAAFVVHARVGDPREALKALRAGALKGSIPRWVRLHEALIDARIDPSPAKVEKAIDVARQAYEKVPTAIGGYSQVLVEFGREEELFEILLNWSRRDMRRLGRGRPVPSQVQEVPGRPALHSRRAAARTARLLARDRKMAGLLLQARPSLRLRGRSEETERLT